MHGETIKVCSTVLLFSHPSFIWSRLLMGNRRFTVYSAHYWKVIKPECVRIHAYCSLLSTDGIEKYLKHNCRSLCNIYILSHEDMFGVRLT